MATPTNASLVDAMVWLTAARARPKSANVNLATPTMTASQMFVHGGGASRRARNKTTRGVRAALATLIATARPGDAREVSSRRIDARSKKNLEDHAMRTMIANLAFVGEANVPMAATEAPATEAMSAIPGVVTEELAGRSLATVKIAMKTRTAHPIVAFFEAPR